MDHAHAMPWQPKRTQKGEAASSTSGPCCHQVLLREVRTLKCHTVPLNQHPHTILYTLHIRQSLTQRTHTPIHHQNKTPQGQTLTQHHTPIHHQNKTSQGQTLLLPPGWALATLTTSPQGAALLSGRFFHGYSGPLMVRRMVVFDMHDDTAGRSWCVG